MYWLTITTKRKLDGLMEGKRNALRIVYSITRKRNLIKLPPSTCKTSWDQ
jgi:hypothetical protein